MEGALIMGFASLLAYAITPGSEGRARAKGSPNQCVMHRLMTVYALSPVKH